MFAQIRYTLLFYLLLLGLTPLIGVVIWQYAFSVDILKDRAINQLKTVREIKRKELEVYFKQTQEEINFLSQTSLIRDAMKEFEKSFFEININDVPREYPARLKKYYQEQLIPNLKLPDTNNITTENYYPKNFRSILLQTQYLISNKTPFKLLNYYKTHNKFNTDISSLVNTYGYYDLFLIEDKTGNIVYSVGKEVDFATSLLDGPHANSNLGKLFRKIRYSGIKNQTIFCDFERYVPSYLAPAAFIASSIFEGNNKIGTLILQIPIDKVDAITTSRKVWREEGLGETGECYIIAKDCKMRSNSRFIIEDPVEFLNQLRIVGTQKKDLEKMDLFKTTVLFHGYCNESLQKAFSNQSGTEIVKDYRNVEVLSSYTPLAIKDVNWVFISEIDINEIFGPVYIFLKKIVILFFCVVLIIVIAALLIANSISKPILKLVNGTNELSNGNMDIRVQVDSLNEIGVLAASFNSTVNVLKLQRENIELQKKEIASKMEEIITKNTLLEHQKEEITQQSESLIKLNSEISIINSRLEDIVKERTQKLREQNEKLLEYTFVNSHKLRAPVARILGLVSILGLTDDKEEKEKIIQLIALVTNELDNIVKDVQAILEKAEFKES